MSDLQRKMRSAIEVRPLRLSEAGEVEARSEKPAEVVQGGPAKVAETGKLDAFSPAELQGKPIPEREWCVEELIPQASASFINADGGTGKTLLGLQLQSSAAFGTTWIGKVVQAGPSLGVYCEDDPDELHRRIASIAEHHQRPLSDLGQMHVVSRVGQDNLLATFDRNQVGKPTPFFQQVSAYAVSIGARLVVLDSLHDLFGGDEISRTQARQFVGLLRNLALTIRGAVVVNAHPSVAGMSSGTGSSGSTAWNNAVRSRLYLTRPTGEDADPDARVLRTMKANYAAIGGEIDLTWKNGVFIPRTQDTSDPYGTAEAVFMACLDKVAQEQRYVSAAPQSGNYAPKVFARMPTARKLSKDKLRRAMDALFHEGRIRVGQHRKPNRHLVEIIERASS